MRKCLATLFYATTCTVNPLSFSHPRSSLYFCHENGPRPPSPSPATSIIISSSRSRYKIYIYRPSIRNLNAFLLIDQSFSNYQCMVIKEILFRMDKNFISFLNMNNVTRILRILSPNCNIYTFILLTS